MLIYGCKILQQNGFLPIHTAAVMGHIPVVKKLVEHYGVSPESITLVTDMYAQNN